MYREFSKTKQKWRIVFYEDDFKKSCGDDIETTAIKGWIQAGRNAQLIANQMKKETDEIKDLLLDTNSSVTDNQVQQQIWEIKNELSEIKGVLNETAGLNAQMSLLQGLSATVIANGIKAESLQTKASAIEFLKLIAAKLKKAFPDTKIDLLIKHLYAPLAAVEKEVEIASKSAGERPR